MSLPPRERGLKLFVVLLSMSLHPVAPPAGAWIETFASEQMRANIDVAPPAGAWIETDVQNTKIFGVESLPPRERGLKLFGRHTRDNGRTGRSPRGSVD